MKVKKPNCRVVQIKPVRIGTSSFGLTIPKWWLDLNNSPERLELTISLDELVIRPQRPLSEVVGNGKK